MNGEYLSPNPKTERGLPFRYHGKCLKIARGKVKDDEKYTCPICDWRVKIPRDAARPKLEDLQAWQEEIPNLPFQPDEEEVLGKIIDNAQEFRTHVSPFCNPIMATAEEVETQRFYLRKIEGAEILLSYETNFFRQALHAYSQVAPTAPPILENSKSTRKPRPTKLQKLMAQHGVDDPENLPQNLRTKPHTFKRKSSEPSSSRPQPLQPAPGRSDSGTPTSHTFPPTASMHHSGPTLSGLPNPHDHAHPAHFVGFPGGSEPHFTMSPQANASPAFAPHAFLHGGLQSPGFSSTSRQPGIFNEAAFGRLDSVALAAGSDSPTRDPYGGSSQGVARMFDELTNQEDSEQGPKGERRSSPSMRKEETTETNWDQDEDMNLFFEGP
jgi:histone demethylase JARID1